MDTTVVRSLMGGGGWVQLVRALLAPTIQAPLAARIPSPEGSGLRLVRARRDGEVGGTGLPPQEDLQDMGDSPPPWFS